MERWQEGQLRFGCSVDALECVAPQLLDLKMPRVGTYWMTRLDSDQRYVRVEAQIPYLEK